MRGLIGYSQTPERKLSVRDNFGDTFKSLRGRRRQDCILILTSLRRFYPTMQWLRKTQKDGMLMFRLGSLKGTRVRVWVASTKLQKFNRQRLPLVMSPNTCLKPQCRKFGLPTGGVFVTLIIGLNSLYSRQMWRWYYDLKMTGSKPKNAAYYFAARHVWTMKSPVITSEISCPPSQKLDIYQQTALRW